jgi:phage repressor protein C with HTH and peptisase S24 domain
MLTHAQIWSAIDRRAAHAGLTASGLARRAGLDPTTFNKSKRITAAGRARWPSTESIAKALAATATTLETFVGLIDGGATRAAALIGVAEADGAAAGQGRGAGSLFPAADGCRQIAFPALDHACALEVCGRTMEPAYRDGDIILVLPFAPLRRGDRVVVCTKSGEVLARPLKRKTAKAIELSSLDGVHADRMLAMVEIAWIGRILWASQ